MKTYRTRKTRNITPAVVMALFIFAATSTTMIAAQEGEQPPGFRPHAGAEVPVAFYYPSTWTVVDRDESVGIVTRPGLAGELGSDQPAIETGDAMLALGVMPAMFLEMMGASPADLDSVLDTMTENISSDAGEVTPEERTYLQTDTREVAAVLFDTPGGNAAGMMLVSRESDEVLAFGMAFGGRQDLQAYRDELAQVLASLEFTGTMQDFMGSR